MASRGNDDLDLDGNWSGGKRRRVAKKRRACDAEQTAEPEQPTPKKRKKGGAVLNAVLSSEQPPKTGATAKVLRRWAQTRLATAWVAEAKAKKLTPIETKEVSPAAAWFVACPPVLPLAQLRNWASKARAFPGSQLLQSLGAGQATPSAPGAAILVLCASTDRLFALKADLDGSWGIKALALAAHGGGRKRDQVLRQAKALAAGATLALATPSRLRRLVEEGHLDLESTSLLIVDLAHDKKLRDVLTLQDTRGDFFALLRTKLAPLLPKKVGDETKKLAFLLCGLETA
ncbi:hypothetical protein AK812_SmicGene6800 [Symbiodinium microadriaticum]|uniref:Protein CMSS1 n=1 Tax=Symbiodinium microadriaticum TaxID=2951 RepID=A0A1Q9EQ75_SYMMI|nr:hypothetical protein AK812_SmicGene6800 [Symbiodinium microadriaticum]